MKTSFASLLLGFVVAVWLTPVARRLALRFRLVDRPQDGRRVNQKSIPRAGGLAIAAGVLAPILLLAFYENVISHAVYEDMLAVVVLFLGALGALGVGLADDLIRPPAKLRLLALIAIAVLTWAGGHRVEEAVIPGVGSINLGGWSLPVTVLWIVGIIVAFNFVDGLDGLATGIALISTATLFIYALIDRNVLWMTWTGAMAGALMGFLVFNFNPASIFMGDAGSNFLGYLLAVVALQTSRKEATAVSLAVPLCALGVPLLDVTLTMIRRSLLRQGLFTSEQGHLHHRLLQLGLSHRRAVLVLYAVTAVLCLGAVLIRVPLLDLRVMIAVVISLVMFGLMFATGYVRPRDLLQMYHQGLANEARQQRVEAACQELSHFVRNAGDGEVALPHILENLVERSCVTGVQYRCERCPVVIAGDYDHSAKGTRFMVQGGRSRATALVFWKDRTTEPSPRESAALRNLFGELECPCVTVLPAFAQNTELGEGQGLQPCEPLAISVKLERVWAALVETADRLSVQRIQLEVKFPGLAEGFNATWEKSAPKDTNKSWRLDVPVMSESCVVGYLKVIGDFKREDIASLLDVLETSESYLASVLRDQGQRAVSEHASFPGGLHGSVPHQSDRVKL
jgi:UDP-GlcNAc:undecaprenyl-phosphate GlcNAc-1-phosphate transferase